MHDAAAGQAGGRGVATVDVERQHLLGVGRVEQRLGRPGELGRQRAAEQAAAGAAVGVDEQQLVAVLRAEALGGDDASDGAGALLVVPGFDEGGDAVHGGLSSGQAG